MISNCGLGRHGRPLGSQPVPGAHPGAVGHKIHWVFWRRLAILGVIVFRGDRVHLLTQLSARYWQNLAEPGGEESLIL